MIEFRSLFTFTVKRALENCRTYSIRSSLISSPEICMCRLRWLPVGSRIALKMENCAVESGKKKTHSEEKTNIELAFAKDEEEPLQKQSSIIFNTKAIDWAFNLILLLPIIILAGKLSSLRFQFDIIINGKFGRDEIAALIANRKRTSQNYHTHSNNNDSNAASTEDVFWRQ